MQVFDEDSANDVVAEERKYNKEVQQKKNFILGLHSEEVKQQLWQHHFHIEPLPTDDNVY